MIRNGPNEIPDGEEQLIRAVAEGNQRAFRLLVEAHWSRVYANTLTLVRSAAIAQELTQDVFLKIWTQRDKLAGVDNFAGYIYVVGRNQVLAALRKKVMETSLLDSEDIVDNRLLPDGQLELKETYRVVLEGIEQLTPRQKLIFNMSRMEGLSHEEIASRLSLSRNTVKVHIVIALNFLRTYIRDHLGKLSALIVYLLYWATRK